MKFTQQLSLVLFCLLAWSGPVWADRLLQSYEWAIRGGFPSSSNHLKETQKIIDMAQQVAALHGVEVQLEQLSSDRGTLTEYPALRIVASQASAANQEALKVQQAYDGLKLYLSPYDLKRSSSDAFFSLEKRMIGVPFDFIYNRVEQEPYLHEKIHAETFRQLILGEQDQLAGVVRVIAGGQVSPNVSEGYIRHFAMDEGKATLRSTELNVQQLYQRYKDQERSFFIRNRDNQQLADNVYFNLETSQGLSRQQQDVNTRALQNLVQGRFKLGTEVVSLGDRLQREVYTYTFLIDSYSREVMPGGGRTEMVAKPEGTELKYYALKADPTELKSRMEQLIVKAQQDLIRIEKGFAKMYRSIELVELERSDLQGLYEVMKIQDVKKGSGCRAKFTAFLKALTQL